MRLTDYFRSEGLFSYTDYHIDAKTFFSGYIRLELSTYTPAAEKAAEMIHDLTIAFDEDEISAGLLQIMAEKNVDIEYYDQAIAGETLQRYHQQIWQPLENVLVENAKHIRKTRRGLGFIEKSTRQFMVLRHVISIDKDFIMSNEGTFMPLFAVISRAIGNNLREIIPDTSFCFSYDEMFTSSVNVVKDSNLYRIDKRQATTLTTELAETTRLLGAMKKHGFVAKLAYYLQHAAALPMMSPDDEEVTVKTGMVVGSEGWHKLGTEENINTVLRHMTIEYKLGKSTQRVSLSTLVR
jgi:hypothetical protein